MIKAKDAAEMVRTLDLVGAMVAIVLFLSSIITFGVRLSAGATAGRWTGIPFYLMTAPLVFLLFMAPRVNRSFLYYLQVLPTGDDSENRERRCGSARRVRHSGWPTQPHSYNRSSGVVWIWSTRALRHTAGGKDSQGSPVMVESDRYPFAGSGR